jgi:hypothetical protein
MESDEEMIQQIMDDEAAGDNDVRGAFGNHCLP